MDNREKKEINLAEMNRAAGGNFIADAFDAVDDAIGYVKNQMELRDASSANTKSLRQAAEKNGIEKLRRSPPGIFKP